jgi:phage gpG-like protein
MSGVLEFSQFKLGVFEDKLTTEKRRILLGSISGLMLSQRLEVFNDQGGLSKWQALSPKYAAYKARKYGGKSSKILSASDALKQSFTPENGPGSSFREVSVTDQEASISSHMPYAAIQNFGGVIFKNNSRDTQNFKVFTSGENEGQHRFASRKDVIKGGGRDHEIIQRNVTSHSMATAVTIPARPFDEFRPKDTEEISQFTESFINGK